MVKLIPGYKAEATWEKLELVPKTDSNEEVSCELLVRRPDFTEQLVSQSEGQLLLYLQLDQRRRGELTDNATIVANHRLRVNLVVRDWRGVTDGKKDVPYSPDMLDVLCSQYPQLLARLEMILDRYLLALPGDLEKNLPLPPHVGGTETKTETEVSTDCSESGTSLPSGSDSGTS